MPLYYGSHRRCQQALIPPSPSSSFPYVRCSGKTRDGLKGEGWLISLLAPVTEELRAFVTSLSNSGLQPEGLTAERFTVTRGLWESQLSHVQRQDLGERKRVKVQFILNSRKTLEKLIHSKEKNALYTHHQSPNFLYI